MTPRTMLPHMRTGDEATIQAITVGPGLAKRLADMGFVRGASIRMVRSGVPCIVRVDGSSVGLGRKIQTGIQLAPPM